jgi:RNA polymerase sigma factor (sigma-70 family)
MARRYSDQEVISNLKSADTRLHNDAIAHLHKTYEAMIVRYVRFNSGTREDGEELLNDVIMTFFRNVRSGAFEQQDDVKVSTYFYGVAKRKWWKELKKRKIRPEIMEDSNDMIWGEEADESQLAAYENSDLVQRLLEKLEPGCQKLVRAFMDGWSMEDIALLVGLKNADSAKAQKYHCLKKLGKLSNQSI